MKLRWKRMKQLNTFITLKEGYTWEGLREGFHSDDTPNPTEKFKKKLKRD